MSGSVGSTKRLRDDDDDRSGRPTAVERTLRANVEDSDRSGVGANGRSDDEPPTNRASRVMSRRR